MCAEAIEKKISQNWKRMHILIRSNELQNLQPYIDKIPDICVETYPTELVTYLNGTEKMKNEILLLLIVS